MVQIHCDGCGTLLKENGLRYKVSIDVRAAFNEIEIGLMDMVRDHRKEIASLLDRLRHRDPAELEAQIYKKLNLDLCPACQHAFIKNPLRFHPEQGARDSEWDFEGFLRSLTEGDSPDRPA